MAWTWRYEDAAGQPFDAPDEAFTSQSDAESWLGQHWRDLAKAGAAIALLVEDDHCEYRTPLVPAARD